MTNFRYQLHMLEQMPYELVEPVEHPSMCSLSICVREGEDISCTECCYYKTEEEGQEVFVDD